ncbi:glucoamylase family protein [Lentisphaera marina]|uniref:glucoamylase family protein n=1 Tax=Lentisphaera marina TaxID=1111041 RepID=UPI0023666A49|nr:glucoamylase family protein [Lentisphaera marina]MDD7987188.1 glucoamylase family protein [Lentisphaera marina]
MKTLSLFISILLILLSTQAQSHSDKDLLKRLHADTWNCLDSMIDPGTGFPQDTQYPGGHTNTTNIGLYLASLCVAVETNLTTHEHGFLRAERILTSLESLERLHGFIPHILDVQLKSKKATGYVAISDFNKLIVGLIMTKQIWPKLSPRVDKFINAVQWEKLYHKETGNVSWGYDFDKDMPLGNGQLWLTADTRSAAFLMIATGAAPPRMWAAMDRSPLYTPYGKILRGYGMGGLFMMAMDSIFLDELATEVGESSGNFAWQQIQFSKKRGYPFWGWSNCYMPGKGYTEGGHLSEQVITPHALALMIDFYPRHVTQALRGLIDSGGSKGPHDFEDVNWGLRDAYNMKTKEWDHRYLSLDQGMLFLALSNHLHDGLVRKIYSADPLVQHGLKLIAPYTQTNKGLINLWAQRDAQIDALSINKKSTQKSLHIKPLLPKLINNAHIKAQTNANQSISISFDNKASEEPHHVALELPLIDISGLKSMQVNIDKIDSSKDQPGWLRLMLIDEFNQSRYAHIELNKSQLSYQINLETMLGIHINEHKIKSLQLVFWSKPWYYQDFKMKADKVSLQINKIDFLQ